MSTLKENKQSMAKGFAILSIAGLLVKVISLLYVPVLRYILREEGIGLYGKTYQEFTYLYILTNSGIPVAISKGVSEQISLKNGRDANRLFQLSRLILSIIGAVTFLIMFVFSDFFAGLVKSQEISLALKVLSPTLLFTAILSSYRGYFQGREIMTPTGISQVVEQITNTVFSLLFAFILMENFGLNAGVAGGTVGTSIGAFVAIIIVYCYYRKNKYDRNIIHKKRQFSDKELLRKIVQYSVPMTICIGIQNAGLIIDPRIITSRLLVAGFTEKVTNIYYGYLFQYNQLIFVPITITMALAVAIIPAVTSAIVRKNMVEAVEKIKYSYKLCFMIAFPCAVGLMVLGNQICVLLGYDIVTGTLLNYGAGVLILMAVVQIQTSILQGIGKLYLVTINALIGLVAKIIVNYYLVAMPEINIYGAIIASAAGFLVILILNQIIIVKSIKKNINLLSIMAAPFISSLLMGAGVIGAYLITKYILFFLGEGYINNAVSTITAILVGVAVYGTLMIILGGITKRDLDNMPSKVKRIIPAKLMARMK